MASIKYFRKLNDLFSLIGHVLHYDNTCKFNFTIFCVKNAKEHIIMAHHRNE